MIRFLLPFFLAATPAIATEFTFTVPMKSGPLFGDILTGSIDLEDGEFTGKGTETFFGVGHAVPDAGDIVGFTLNVRTLTFTEANTLVGPTSFMIRFVDGEVSDLTYVGALFSPGASAFLTINTSKNEADLRTTGGQGEELRSLGGPFSFTLVP